MASLKHPDRRGGRSPLCKVPGCEQPHTRDSRLCEEHLAGRVQCTYQIKEKALDGTLYTRQCKSASLQGTILCHKHSGVKSHEVAIQTEAQIAMQRYVKPFEGDIDPIRMFEQEFRRTYGKILWLEDQISRLTPEEVIWGRTKEERIGAAEFQGTNRTMEARVNGYVVLLQWERKHLLDLEKLWVGAKLDQQKINIMKGHIEYTYGKVTEVARMLGHDPESDAVRSVLERAFSTGDKIGSTAP